jgi:hypothetical protein
MELVGPTLCAAAAVALCRKMLKVILWHEVPLVSKVVFLAEEQKLFGFRLSSLSVSMLSKQMILDTISANNYSNIAVFGSAAVNRLQLQVSAFRIILQDSKLYLSRWTASQWQQHAPLHYGLYSTASIARLERLTQKMAGGNRELVASCNSCVHLLPSSNTLRFYKFFSQF